MSRQRSCNHNNNVRAVTASPPAAPSAREMLAVDFIQLLFSVLLSVKYLCTCQRICDTWEESDDGGHRSGAREAQREGSIWASGAPPPLRSPPSRSKTHTSPPDITIPAKPLPWATLMGEFMSTWMFRESENTE